MRTLAAGIAILTGLLAGCQRKPADAVACVPPGTRAIVGIRLDQANRLPALGRLRERLPGADGATFVLAAWDGSALLLAAEGAFAAPPAGATMVSPGLALFGAPAWVGAALAQYRTGTTGAPELAARIPRDRVLWAVVRGDVALPLAGNAANLNRVLRMTEYTTVGMRLGPAIEVEVEGVCRGADEAERLRATLGAMLLLANPGARPAIERRDHTVRLSLAVSEAAAGQWVEAFLRAR